MPPRKRPARRAPGEGSWHETATGWRLRLPVGAAPSGKAILKDFYGRTKPEAQAKADDYRRANPNGPPSADRAQPFYEFLALFLARRRRDQAGSGRVRRCAGRRGAERVLRFPLRCGMLSLWR